MQLACAQGLLDLNEGSIACVFFWNTVLPLATFSVQKNEQQGSQRFPPQKILLLLWAQNSGEMMNQSVCTLQRIKKPKGTSSLWFHILWCKGSRETLYLGAFILHGSSQSFKSPEHQSDMLAVCTEFDSVLFVSSCKEELIRDIGWVDHLWWYALICAIFLPAVGVLADSWLRYDFVLNNMYSSPLSLSVSYDFLQSITFSWLPLEST